MSEIFTKVNISVHEDEKMVNIIAYSDVVDQFQYIRHVSEYCCSEKIVYGVICWQKSKTLKILRNVNIFTILWKYHRFLKK